MTLDREANGSFVCYTLTTLDTPIRVRAGFVRDLHCICGHWLGQHPDNEKCGEAECSCLQFEIDWIFEDEIPA